MSQFITKVRIQREAVPSWEQFPYSIPAVKVLDEVSFDQPVTIFAGENGSGKSTIIESLATLAGFNHEGGSKQMRFQTMAPDNVLEDILTLGRSPRRELDGFFLRAETMFGVMNYMHEVFLPGELLDQYGHDPHRRSHGESFLDLMQHRFRSNSLFILDEPEAALSPSRQLFMLRRMMHLADQGCQFIISTHSPLLMAFPGAKLYWLSSDGIEERTMRETEHYAVMKRFVDDPEGYLKLLGLVN